MTSTRDLRPRPYAATVIDGAERRRMTPDRVGVESEMIAREEVLALPETAPTATATSTGTASWSFASPPATPPAGTSSPAGMIVVPGSGMDVVQRYEYTGRELASESSGYYFRYRVYGPELGQFFTRDPLGYVDGMGLYEGRFGSHVSIDPEGRRAPVTPIGADACTKGVAALLEDKKDTGLQELLTLIGEPARHCPKPDASSVTCECCGSKDIEADEYGAYYHPQTWQGESGNWYFLPPKRKIRLCSDLLPVNGLREVLYHEVVHWLDNCPRKDTELATCEQTVCSELRAYDLSGACNENGLRYDSAVDRKQCLKNAAMRSASGRGGCPVAGLDNGVLDHTIDSLLPRCTGTKPGALIGDLIPHFR